MKQNHYPSRPIVILGAGEQAQVVANIFRLQKQSEVIFLDDHRQAKQIKGVLSDFPQFLTTHCFHVAFGNNELRHTWFERLRKAGATFISAIHPQAWYETSVQLGDNCMIGAAAYLNINTRVGHNCIVNSGAILEHDTQLDESVFIGPRACTAGGVHIQSMAMVGMGALILDDLVISVASQIGAGAVVTQSTQAGGTYIGVPARRRITQS